MSKCTPIRYFCGDYAFDVEYSAENKFTMFFNSRRNAETVKKCIEVDDSVPNAATAVDFVEVVRCSECKWFVPKHIKLNDGTTRAYTEEEKKLPLGVTGDVGINCGSRCLRCLYWEENSTPVYVQECDYCSYGERRSEDESV